jgi:PAS domain S-box-containing protein
MVHLFRGDGLLLARSPADGAALGQRFGGLALFQTLLPQADHGTYRARFGSDKIDRIVAYRAVSQYPLVVTVSKATAEIIAAWRQTALIGAGALLMLAAAVMLLLLWLSRALRREAASTRALAVNEARARSTLETLADGVITVDARGAVQSFNPAAEQMFGCTAADIIGRSADSLLGVGRFSEILSSLSAADGRSVGAARREIEARRRDGKLFPAEIRVGIAHGDPAVGDLSIVTLRDLTEEKALQHQLQESQKLEVVGHLTGGIAHDFGNVLAGITMNLESALRQLSAETGARGQLDAALQATRGGREIVQRLMAFARRQSLNPCSSDLNQLISNSMPLLRQGRGPGITIETRLSGGLAPILVDRSGLESAVLNLVVNANDAMPQGGTITLETGQVTIGTARAAEWGIRAGSYATLAVRDTGSGMTPDVERRIFEPFFTTKLSGTGLGLSMVQSFVAQSGGHIEVESKPEAGTSITMFFPMLRGRHGAAADWFTQLATSPPATGRSVLLVEDNAIVRDGLMLLLQQLGHRPIAAADAEEASALLDQNPQIELLLTDIGLPGMNGRQLARIARGRKPGLKVLFATGYDTTIGGERPLAEVDANTGLLMKPFFEEDLIKEIQRLFQTAPRHPNGEQRKPRAANGDR